MSETQNTGQFAKTIVTDVGKDMIAKSQNGQTLTFSRVALGDGLVGEEEDVTKFTAVKNERLSLPIAKYSNLGNGQFQIQFRLTNSQVESGFWHREIGIMAKIDNGQEQLYAYTTAGNKASFIYDKTTPVEERIVNVNFVIGNAQNLEVIINSSVIYATIEDLEEALDAHNAADDAHTDKIASQAEAEAQSNQNNKKFMTPLRVYQAIVAYFTQFLAAAVFTGIVKAVAPSADSNDKSVPTTSWVRTCFESMAKTVAEILEIQWKTEATGYLLLGPYLGNLKILWGLIATRQSDGIALSQYPIAFDNVVFCKIGTISQLGTAVKAITNTQETYNTLEQICFNVVGLEELDVIPSVYFLAFGK